MLAENESNRFSLLQEHMPVVQLPMGKVQGPYWSGWTVKAPNHHWQTVVSATLGIGTTDAFTEKTLESLVVSEMEVCDIYHSQFDKETL